MIAAANMNATKRAGLAMELLPKGANGPSLEMNIYVASLEATSRDFAGLKVRMKYYALADACQR